MLFHDHGVCAYRDSLAIAGSKGGVIPTLLGFPLQHESSYSVKLNKASSIHHSNLLLRDAWLSAQS